MIKITLPVFESCVLNLKHPEVAMRAAVSKAMQEAGIPHTWRMSESHPRLAAPGKLTFFHDRLMDQFEITWEPENELLSKSN